MTPSKRWRIAIPLASISATLLGATALGAWAFWGDDSAAERALTLFLGLMFAGCLGISLSVGVDRQIQDIPWMRIGWVTLLILLACGVSWIRDGL